MLQAWSPDSALIAVPLELQQLQQALLLLRPADGVTEVAGLLGDSVLNRISSVQLVWGGSRQGRLALAWIYRGRGADPTAVMFEDLGCEVVAADLELPNERAPQWAPGALLCCKSTESPVSVLCKAADALMSLQMGAACVLCCMADGTLPC